MRNFASVEVSDSTDLCTRVWYIGISWYIKISWYTGISWHLEYRHLTKNFGATEEALNLCQIDFHVSCDGYFERGFCHMLHVATAALGVNRGPMPRASRILKTFCSVSHIGPSAQDVGMYLMLEVITCCEAQSAYDELHESGMLCRSPRTTFLPHTIL